MLSSIYQNRKLIKINLKFESISSSIYQKRKKIKINSEIKCDWQGWSGIRDPSNWWKLPPSSLFLFEMLADALSLFLES
jgi:hypothetical protein